MSTRNSVKAVIFDMDGVLSDSEPIYHLSLNQVLNEHGHVLTEGANKQILGTTVQYSWKWLQQHFGLEGDLDHWIAKYDSVVVKNLKEQVKPSPGLYQLLDALKRRNLRLALASSSQGNWVETLLTTLGIQGRFEVVVSGEMVADGKPHPEIYLMTARKLGVEPAQCLVIEDSPHGIKAAKAAGMRVIAILTPFTQDLDLSLADRIIDSLDKFDFSLLCPPSQRVY